MVLATNGYTDGLVPWVRQLEGSLDLWIGETLYRLEEGDSVTHSSRVPHRNKNNGDPPAKILFILTPPSY